MAFTQVSASLAARGNGVLSADNAMPEKHIVVEVLREAAPLLGLAPSVLATLEALLSCLPPKRNHHMVFASNATLCFRRNGLSDRTLRRHASSLIEAGLLERQDSPNGKRYSRSSTAEGQVLRFGFDLSPLFARMDELAALAAAAREAEERCAYLRSLLRSEAQNRLRADETDATALALLKTLRRKLEADALQELVDRLPQRSVKTQDLTATNGQNVRHYQNSKKENIDKESAVETTEPLTIPELLEICSEAKQFALSEIETSQDVITHARRLAPMIGINQRAYHASEARLGLLNTALTIWGLLQRQTKIRKLAAYFHAVTAGAKSHQFDAIRFVRMSASYA